jgi:hypothetical protein
MRVAGPEAGPLAWMAWSKGYLPFTARTLPSSNVLFQDSSMTICSVRPRALLAFDRRGTRTHHCHDVRDLASISDPNRLPTPFCILRHNSLFTHFCMGPSRVGDNVDCKCNGATAVQHLDTSLLTQALDAESCVTNPCGTARGCCLVQTRPLTNAASALVRRFRGPRFLPTYQQQRHGS